MVVVVVVVVEDDSVVPVRSVLCCCLDAAEENNDRLLLFAAFAEGSYPIGQNDNRDNCRTNDLDVDFVKDRSGSIQYGSIMLFLETVLLSLLLLSSSSSSLESIVVVWNKSMTILS